MTAREIQELAQQMRKDDPYFQRAFRRQPDKLESSTLAERVSVALSDPAFLWNVAESHALAELPLPALGWGEAVRRAHRYLVDADSTDIQMALAAQFNLPEARDRRDLLRSVLI